MQRPTVLVVGGGMAGMSLGCELAVDHDVTVLEAETALAVHTTGRSAALFLLDYGPGAVQELTAASEELFNAFSAEPESPPLLTPRGLLLTAWDDTGLSHLPQPSEAVVACTSAEALSHCGFLRTDLLLGATYDRRAADIDVMALHAHYVSKLRRRGGTVVTGARLTSARRSSVMWEVGCTDGRTFRAERVVNASGAWGDVVASCLGLSGHALAPKVRTIVMARSRGVAVPAGPAVGEAQERWYFKPESAGLVLSPADETPALPSDVRPDPLDVALALERVNEVTTLGLRSIVSAWAGLRTFAPDRIPLVGPHPQEPSVFCFLGQGGYGIQMAPALARVGAEIFRGGTPPLAGALAVDRGSPAGS